MELKRWLITGGCGFIGTGLIKALVAEGGHFIRVLDNLSIGTREDLSQVCRFKEFSPDSLITPYSSPITHHSSPITHHSSLITHHSSPITHHSSLLTHHPSPVTQLIVGDIKDYDTCLKCSENIDIIIHLAANTGVGPSVENPRTDMEANVMGTFNMLEAARQNKVKRFVFASSGAPVGECIPPIHEELAPHPVSPYGAGKLAGEGYCSAYFRTFGLETVALRFGNVYGPGSGHKNSVVAKFIRQVMKGEMLEIYGDGNQTRDFIYITDIIRAVRLAAEKPGIGGEIFQIASSAETTVRDLTENLLVILKDMGYKNMQVNYTAPRIGDVRRNFSDTSKARKMLGWYPETGLDKGLRQTAEWFMNFPVSENTG